MGQGGFITLVNSTDSDWTRTGQHAYQMNAWEFPDTIAAKTSTRVYVEWDQGIFHDQQDDAAEVYYTINDGHHSCFQIQARAKKGFELQVVFDNLVSSGNPAGSTLRLGWQHNGIVSFILAGRYGDYTGSNLQSADWMSQNLALLGDKKLRDVCISGSHDSGMSVYTSGTAFAHSCNTLTQSANLQGQLILGARYFDIRPVISDGDYYTGHYSEISQIGSWQGANGQSIASVVSDINAFVAHNNELVILNLSHALNTDVGNAHYRPFTQTEWDGLFDALSGLSHLYVADANSDLTQLTLNQFISGSAAVLLLVGDSNVELGAHAGKGFFPASSLPVYNSYADKNTVAAMTDNQLDKMQQHAPEDYFLLSWTLTQDATQATTCALGVTSSIKALADEANQNLAYLLYPAITPQAYPNIIYTDNLINSDAAAMAMAVNWTVLS
ncbi:hypothetical protein [Pseudoalteromonas rubra]|uniref:Phosphatidylinositol diacylglycerol-lyase n=1 Tax=Pseudoalteromonas rubra TaxID=43658 RepID=A0A5S3WQ79_9GAMM|nr:hypothetical protein [Pseudoalteromonas rubra]TMP31039.1 hypothetical protein CWB98_22795 [Pseudoalteromonas rubra]